MTRKTMATPRRVRKRRSEWQVKKHVIEGGSIVIDKALDAFHARPRTVSAALAIIALGLVVGLIPGERDEQPAARTAVVQLPGQTPTDPGVIEIPAIAESQATPTDPVEQGAMQRPADGAFDPQPESVTEVDHWLTVEVRSGQTLERIFRDLGLSPRLLHQVVNINEHTRELARIRPGDEFAFHIDDELGFQALRAELDEEYWLFVEQNGEGLAARTEPRELERRITEASGTISTSLYHGARQAGLSDNMVMRLASIFGWDIDFALDIRAGDRFALVYEEVWRDGEFLRDGPILAARFVNQGESFEALRFDAGNGPDYFAPDGRPMRKAFLRAPLNFTRVTSNFNPRRFHPITRRVRPHNGTDYGAPTGTPVWAAGDGRVIESAYNNVNGHYIFVQHGNNIVTRYLHLSRREVNRGDRVRQGQTIGRVGATGLATGPHLHYEFLVNGTHRNPRTVDLPPADPLPDDQLPAFSALGQQLLARLDNVDQPHLMLASADKECEQSGQNC